VIEEGGVREVKAGEVAVEEGKEIRHLLIELIRKNLIYKSN
jgi:hypothetical protein